MVLLLCLKLYTIFIRLISLSDIYLTILDGHFELNTFGQRWIGWYESQQAAESLRKKDILLF